MLLSHTATVKWNAKNKKRFVELGYQFTRVRDEFDVDVNHLNHASNALVVIQCDYCHKKFDITWAKYMNNHRNGSEKDACFDCKWIKGRDSMEDRYGTRIIRKVPGAEEKLQNTNLQRYGCINPFGNADIKEKIKTTNIAKYGVASYTQNDEYLVKSRATCLDKYGVDHWMKLEEYASATRGQNSPLWKGGVARERNERGTYDYQVWRNDVFARDMYTCQKCGDRNGNGHSVILHVHHILNWRDNEDDRYNVDNGITLCEKCHAQFHSIFGKRYNTADQMESFLCHDEKVC